ncbi:MAG: MFS transporter, partial [Rhodospirillaceae bacterium]|nr:MFS transporter [Rhodospirillaceae bacterium]
FQAAYAVGYLTFGAIIDKIGARIGFGAAVIIWTIAHMAHAACSTVMHFMIARFALGIGESGNFPAGLKSIAEWFPKRERAFATGIFNAGTNVGAVVTPLIVPFLTIAYGWQSAFIVTGLLSVVWLVVWFWFYRKPSEDPHLSEAERAHILSDPPDTESAVKMPWKRLLGYKETWAYAAGKFLIDPIWWMFLFWLPDFLAKRYGMDLKTFGPPLVAIYLISDVGSIVGGWASSKFMARGYSLNAARKITMLICGILVLPVMFAQFADNVWLAVAIIGLATAAHQGFSANLYTLPSDVFPRAAVASVVGIGGTVGAIGGMLMAKYVGWVLDIIGNYTPIFVVAGTVYLLALLVVHLLVPRYEPVKIDS